LVLYGVLKAPGTLVLQPLTLEMVSRYPVETMTDN